MQIHGTGGLVNGWGPPRDSSVIVHSSFGHQCDLIVAISAARIRIHTFLLLHFLFPTLKSFPFVGSFSRPSVPNIPD